MRGRSIEPSAIAIGTRPAPARVMRIGLASLAFALLACTGSEPRVPVARTVATDGGAATSDRGEWLVWARAKDGKATTYRVQRDGSVAGRAAEIRIAAKDGEHVWQTSRKAVATEACDFDGAREAPHEGFVTIGTFVGGRGPQRVVEPSTRAMEGANELRHEVAVVASVGSVVFLEESTYAYACGAHGSVTKGFVTWDLDRGEKLNILATLPDKRAIVGRARAALDERIKEDGGPFGDEVPEITEILPAVRGSQLVFQAQVTIPSCYACSDGLWTSYSRSVRVDAEPPPGLPSGPLPEGVAAFASSHPDLILGGWSLSPTTTADDAAARGPGATDRASLSRP